MRVKFGLRMCGRIIIKKSIQLVEQELNLQASEELHDFRGYNLGPGSQVPVLGPHKKFEMMRFGMRPFWAKKPMLLFNARSEGDFNKDNDPTYNGNKGIFKKPAFRGPIRNKRCIVFVNGFLEGPEKEKLSKPYYVFDQERDFMGLAAIYDEHVDQETGEQTTGFSIITTVPNKITAMIGHHRSPVILRSNEYSSWLRAKHLDEISPLLRPFEGNSMNAFAVSPQIKSPRVNDEDLLAPVGPALVKGVGVRFHEEFERIGFGRRKKL